MADNENPAGAAAAEQPEGPNFAIQRIYVKDLSFETPMGVKVFTQPFQPSVKLDVNTRGNMVGEDQHEIVLTLTVTAEQDGEVAFLIELQQAGVFMVTGFPEDQQRQLLATVCPNFLFPYAREAIDNIAVHGGFPAVALKPLDFDAIYRQSLAAEAEQGGQSVN